MAWSHRVIVYLHYGGDVFRGTEACLRDTIDALHDRGEEVAVVANHPELIAGLPMRRPAVVRTGMFPAVLLEQRDWRAPWQYVAELWRLWRAFRGRQVQAILANSGLPCQLGVPLARLLRVPLICQFYHPSSRRYFSVWLVRFADQIIVPSVVTAASVQRWTGRTPTLIPLGVDLADFQPAESVDPSWRQRLGISEHAFVVLQLAALEPHKRPDQLIRAVALCRGMGHDVVCVLLGDGPMRSALTLLAGEVDVLEHVKITGRVDDVAPFLQHVADVHVLASEHEGFGIAVIEAASCGLANIVSVPSAMEEIVQHEVHGLHVDGGDVHALAAAIISLKNDPVRRARMAAAASAHVAAVFGVDAYKRRVADRIYEAVASGRRRRGALREHLT